MVGRRCVGLHHALSSAAQPAGAWRGAGHCIAAVGPVAAANAGVRVRKPIGHALGTQAMAVIVGTPDGRILDSQALHISHCLTLLVKHALP